MGVSCDAGGGHVDLGSPGTAPYAKDFVAVTSAPASPPAHLVTMMGVSAGAAWLVVWTSVGSDSPLGAPAYWAWLLTLLQVLALWLAGRRCPWGWLLGAGVQPVWIVYALVTSQVGFVPGCLASGVIQLGNYLHSPERGRAGGVPAWSEMTTRSATADCTVLAMRRPSRPA